MGGDTIAGFTFAQAMILLACLIGIVAALVIFRVFINVIIIDVCILGDFTACRELICCRRSRLRGLIRRQRPIEEGNFENNSIEVRNQSSSDPTNNPVSYYLHSMNPLKKIVVEPTLLSMALFSYDAVADENDSTNTVDAACKLCSICLHKLDAEEECVSIKSCSHPYHKKCIHSWLQQSLECPLCRKLVLSEDELSELISDP